MDVKYSEELDLSDNIVALSEYRDRIQSIVETRDFSQAEASLCTYADPIMRKGIKEIKDAIGEVKHVILIGIGGSSLGTEAIHEALDGGVTLHILDSVSPHRIDEVIKSLLNIKKEDFVICAISKSGSTTETLTNITVLLDELGKVYGAKPYDRLVCIGNPGNALLVAGEALGAHIFPMHEAVGGRYSVFTSVGLVPLAFLGHDVDPILDGLESLFNKKNEVQAAYGAATIFSYLNDGVRTINFFALDTRFEKLGYWYRQLSAESLGKETDVDGNPVEIGFIPTTSTPVELHSIGQLYFSGFKGVYTDLVSAVDVSDEYKVSSDTTIATKLAGKSMAEIHDAICGGVVGAYSERGLPYRLTSLVNDLPFSLGLFMGTRMLETMYIAKLMNVNAFNQPNVELYKKITRDLLDS